MIEAAKSFFSASRPEGTLKRRIRGVLEYNRAAIGVPEHSAQIHHSVLVRDSQSRCRLQIASYHKLMSDSKKHPAIGIDLGTTFSAVAFLGPDGRPETVRNAEGDLTTPSAVFFDHKHPIVGVEAVEAGLLEPDRLAQFAKRDIGESYYEKRICGKHLPAEVIQALILRKLKEDTELTLGDVQQAVVTVPAFFNEPCRKATQDAGRLAGLDVLDIINEPTAAAICYGVQQGFLSASGESEHAETVLVYDLGGGTFDVTVMKIEGGRFDTVATAGDVYLGGIDWDKRIVDFIAEKFQEEHGVDPREDIQAMPELMRKANQTKHALTQRESVTVAFAHEGMRMRTELTQQEFSERCVDLVDRTIMTVQLVLDDAGITWTDLTRLILVGGSTRMPMIRSELESCSSMALDRSLSPDEAVSHGAALYAGMLLNGEHDQPGAISVSNVNSHDLGVLAIDPKTGEPRRQIMIPRNSSLPARKTVRFRTHTDNQANVKIEIVEGGDDRGTNATKIGKCVVDDLPRGTRKGTNVDVQFDYAADGRLTVRAALPEVDRKITMTLNRAAGLSDDEVESWINVLDSGFSDAALAELPELDQAFEDSEIEPSDNDLPGDAGPSDTIPTDLENAPLGGGLPEVGSASAAPIPFIDLGEPAKKETVAPQINVAGSAVAGSAVAATPAVPLQELDSPPPGSLGSPPVAQIVPEAGGSDINSVLDFTPVDEVAPTAAAPATPLPATPLPTPQQTPTAAPMIQPVGKQQPAAKAAPLGDAPLPDFMAAQKPAVSKGPAIRVGEDTSKPKANQSDMAALAALGGGKPQTKASAPVIMTDSGAAPVKKTNAAPVISVSNDTPGGKKKSGGMFGKKKK